MKARFVFLLFLLNGILSAQSPIKLLPADTSLVELNADISNGFKEFHLGIQLENLTGDTLQVIWRKEMPEDCPLEWETIISDPNQHYLFHVYSNYDTTYNIVSPFPLLPLEIAQYGLSVGLYPNAMPGCCTIPVHLSLLENPDSILTTAHFRFEINDPDCDFVNSFEAIEETVLVYPNPFNDWVAIESISPIEQVEVFNVYGQLLFTENNTNQINTGGLPKGIYLLLIKQKNGMVYSTRVNKV